MCSCHRRTKQGVVRSLLTSSGATPGRVFACPFTRGASVGVGDSMAMLMKRGMRAGVVSGEGGVQREW